MYTSYLASYLSSFNIMRHKITTTNIHTQAWQTMTVVFDKDNWHVIQDYKNIKACGLLNLYVVVVCICPLPSMQYIHKYIDWKRLLFRRAQFLEQLKYCGEPSSSQAPGRGPELRRGMNHPGGVRDISIYIQWCYSCNAVYCWVLKRLADWVKASCSGHSRES